MGVIFGRMGSTLEPPYTTLLSSGPNCVTPYEIRSYGVRFAATTRFPLTDTSKEDVKSPFGVLASYIGVFGDAQNEGSNKMAMTAPVIMSNSGSGDRMSMTAPVITSSSSSSDHTKTMSFLLPSSYTSVSQIPKPTNANIAITEIPSCYGAVHTFNSFYSDSINNSRAGLLATQLKLDGCDDVPMDKGGKPIFQFWGYNPPFTIPYFRRNEIWIQLKEEDLKALGVKKV